MFGFLYALFMTGVGIKETVSNNIDQENAFQKALKENKDIFYDGRGNMYFIDQVKLKNGKIWYNPIRAIESNYFYKDYRGIWHRTIVPIKGNKRVLKDYTQELIDKFYERRDNIKEEYSKKHKKYYFIPLDKETREFSKSIGYNNFKKCFLRDCGWFEMKTEKRYRLECVGSSLNGFRYLKYYYEDIKHNGQMWGQTIDFDSQKEITEKEFAIMGGYEKGGYNFL